MLHRFAEDHSSVLTLGDFDPASVLWLFEIRWWFEGDKQGPFWDGPRVLGMEPSSPRGYKLIVGQCSFRTPERAAAFWQSMVRVADIVGLPDAAMVTMLTALRGEFKVGGFLTTDPKYGRELPAAPPAWFPSGPGFPLTVYDHLLV